MARTNTHKANNKKKAIKASRAAVEQKEQMEELAKQAELDARNANRRNKVKKDKKRSDADLVRFDKSEAEKKKNAYPLIRLIRCCPLSADHNFTLAK